MIIGRFNLQTVLVKDFKRVFFGVEFVKKKRFSYIFISLGYGGFVIGFK